MPRPPRIFYAGAVHHIFARGNNCMELFRTKLDYRIYRKLWVLAKRRFNLRIHRWCLMTNHVHFLLRQLKEDGISEAMLFVQARYARYFGRQYGWTGHVWQKRYSNRLVAGEDYFRVCALYIERNPARAKMVERPEDYPWSSAAFYAKGRRDPLTDRDHVGDATAAFPQLALDPPKLFVGRRAGGRREELEELSARLGKRLVVTARGKVPGTFLA